MEGLGILTDQFVSGFIHYLTFGIDIIAGIIIGVAVVLAFISFLKNLKKSTTIVHLGLETTRLGLARSLLLALDFEIGERYTQNYFDSFYNRSNNTCSDCSCQNSFELVALKRVG